MEAGSEGTLDFSTLDDLAFAADRGRLGRSTIPILSAVDVGPLVEMASLASGGLLPGLLAAPWLRLGGLAPMVQELRDRRTKWVCPRTQQMGFMQLGSQQPSDERGWASFGMQVQRAAMGAGFLKGTASQLTAALGEMYSNIYEHSGKSETGVIAFRGAQGVFEFVASDRGIGVLESLRSCSEYRDIDDHGDALRLALREGVSRFGSAANRGHGFDAMFVGLANLNGNLRLRSGDHALVMDGRNPSAVRACSEQKAKLEGLVISVKCER